MVVFLSMCNFRNVPRLWSMIIWLTILHMTHIHTLCAHDAPGGWSGYGSLYDDDDGDYAVVEMANQEAEEE